MVFSKSRGDHLKYVAFPYGLSMTSLPHYARALLSSHGGKTRNMVQLPYRHYECIGLGTIPIANVGPLYKKLFGCNMVCVEDTEEMIRLYKEMHPRFPSISPPETSSVRTIGKVTCNKCREDAGIPPRSMPRTQKCPRAISHGP